jgi:hypothetical protein
MLLRQAINRSLDRVVRPELRLLRWQVSAFKSCGYIGLALAVLLAAILVAFQNLSLWVLACIIVSAVLTFLGLALFTKVLTGEERLVYYHHEIAVVSVAAGLLWLLHEPTLPYLDVTILGIGTFLVWGRIGCLMVGCCHGRPYPWGVCYCSEHVRAGFTAYYVGVRLFPIQAVESLWVLGIVLVGTGMVLGRRAPGEALAWYIVTYDVGRFHIEFLRGDPKRPYRWGFSEGQWISVLLTAAVVWAELSGVLVLHIWHAAALTWLMLTMIVVALERRWHQNPGHQLYHPAHVQELAAALEQVSNAAIVWTGPVMP